MDVGSGALVIKDAKNHRILLVTRVTVQIAHVKYSWMLQISLPRNEVMVNILNSSEKYSSCYIMDYQEQK